MLYPPNEWQYPDATGLTMPWFAKPFLDVLEEWTKYGRMAGWRVFEWGAGYSTIWWSRYVAHLETMEHNAEWLEAIKKHPTYHRTGGKLWHCPADHEGYVLGVCGDRPYDCIVIDGERRVDCARTMFAGPKPRIKLGGIVILDNSDMPENQGVFELLKFNEHHTFPQPGHPHWCTTYWRITEFSSPPENPTVAAAQQRKLRNHPG